MYPYSIGSLNEKYDCMLHDLDWLKDGQAFPPASQRERIKRYKENEMLFEGNHFGIQETLYQQAATRITRVIGNFESMISFPVLLNYQRLMSLKTADLVCGEHPSISTTTDENQKLINTARRKSNFDEKLYSTAIDLSRMGDSIWRWFIDAKTKKKNFTVWSPMEWFPIVSNDGTNTITHQVLAWVETSKDGIFYLKAQVHIDGSYSEYVFEYNGSNNGSGDGTLGKQISGPTVVPTGYEDNAVQNIKAFGTSSHIFGYDDYDQIDSILVELMVRVAQISNILDQHADPSLYGPSTLLEMDEKTGKLCFKKGKYYALNPNDLPPEYLTWDGKIDSAFKECEMLVNHLYILSEMGAALLGSGEGSTGQAISGTAMRFKMVNPLAKVRRVSNSMTSAVITLFEQLTGIDADTISVEWKDGLPDDPKETLENANLATKGRQLMPSREAIVKFFDKTLEEADKWLELVAEEPPIKPMTNAVTTVNPRKRGSELGFSDVSKPKEQSATPAKDDQ